MSITTDSKTEIIAKLIAASSKSDIKDILVVGCGSGIEAAILAQTLKAKVVGIDIEDKFDAEASRLTTLIKCNATELIFDDLSFDFIYSYHALEHIYNPEAALYEMSRVLKDGGGYWVGTPNRLRLVGYLGSKDAAWTQKLMWNFVDWKARMFGKFRNEMGAHAGFSSKELYRLLDTAFLDSNEVTNKYYVEVYKNKRSLIDLIISTGLSKYLFPSVYFTGVKNKPKIH